MRRKNKSWGRVWSNADHGDGEVDYIGGVTKIFNKIAVSNYYFFDKSSEMISHLFHKFAGKAYKFVKIYFQALAGSRAEETCWFDETVVGSEDFQGALVTPGSETLKASPHFCLCDLCILNCSCKLFRKCQVNVKQLKSTLLWLQMLKTLDKNDDIQKNNDDFVIPDTIFAIPAISI